MSDRREKWYIPVEGRDGMTHIKVTLRYEMGGMNYATYKTDPRGYYLSIGPVILSNGDGYTTERYTAFSAVAFVLEETKRLNPKRFAEWHQRIGAILPELHAAYDRRTVDGNDPIVALLRAAA